MLRGRASLLIGTAIGTVLVLVYYQSGIVDELPVCVVLSVDDVPMAFANGLGVISHPVRRGVLRLVAEHPTLNRFTIATRVVSNDRVLRASVELLELTLHYNHLPTLDDYGYVEYDPRIGDVTLRKDPAEVRSELDLDSP